MQRAEFDKFALEYRSLHEANVALSGEKPEYFAEYKIKDLKRIICKFAPSTRNGRILDLGSGVGNSVPFFRRHLPQALLTCADVSVASLEIGAARFGDDASFVAFDGKCLPFADGTFECAFAACVFHHIPQHDHIALLLELRRVLKHSGLLMVFEHNPWNPLTVNAVNTCPFDENAVLIRPSRLRKSFHAAGFRQVLVRYRVFFPRALRLLRALESWMTWLPLGAQYYVCANK
jgi:ubiquinone/menaquinone biosynthesis C-methylase UbiE